MSHFLIFLNSAAWKSSTVFCRLTKVDNSVSKKKPIQSWRSRTQRFRSIVWKTHLLACKYNKCVGYKFKCITQRIPLLYMFLLKIIIFFLVFLLLTWMEPKNCCNTKLFSTGMILLNIEIILQKIKLYLIEQTPVFYHTCI